MIISMHLPKEAIKIVGIFPVKVRQTRLKKNIGGQW